MERAHIPLFLWNDNGVLILSLSRKQQINTEWYKDKILYLFNFLTHFVNSQQVKKKNPYLNSFYSILSWFINFIPFNSSINVYVYDNVNGV